MRVVIQRVKQASVAVDDQCIAQIGQGLLVLVGLAKGDMIADQDYIMQKIIKLRVFADEQGNMNRSIQDIQGEVLLVSQFTLYADCSKGNRPSFMHAMPPQEARTFYEQFVDRFKTAYSAVQTGQFQADMAVSLVNDGPVTIVLDSNRQ